MDKIRYMIVIVAAVGYLWFAAPLAAKRIVNIGNLTGMAVFGLLLLYGCYLKRIGPWIVRLWAVKAGKTVLTLVFTVLILIAGTVVWETCCMVKAAGNTPPENVTAIVLGCSVIGTRPSRILQERLEAAYTYLQENPGAQCILSGGQGDGEDISEAECMYRYLTEKGIDKERLLLEDKSTTTEENLQFSKEILEEHGLGNQITIVTSEFHAYRAGIMADKTGLESYSSSSKTMLLYLPTYYVRELYGILFYMVAK